MSSTESSASPVLPPPTRKFAVTGGVLLGIAVLYLGRQFFIPFASSILLAFALQPIVRAVRRLRLPRAPAVVAAVSLAFLIIAAVSYVVTIQLVKLAKELPSYQYTMSEKLKSLRQSGEDTVFERLSATIEGLEKDLSRAKKSAPDQMTTRSEDVRPDPVTVRLEPTVRSPLEIIRNIFGPMIETLAAGGIIIVFLIFVLIEKEELRDRFIKILGAGDLQTSTQALDEAGARVSRYLLMQLVVNVTYGVPIGVGLYFIGVPNAVLWGVLAAVLRFIPYLGPLLAALFPLALAFAVDPGWSMLMWVVGLFVVLELISNNIVEPWLYGASTGLSSLAIVSAAVFWTLLWGPMGLVLSTPLTVCLVVVGSYVPQLSFFKVLLSTEPVLAPQEQLYQRLLSGDAEEAAEIAEVYLTDRTATEFYDRVAIPALRLAEEDRHRPQNDGAFKRRVADGMVALVREVAEMEPQPKLEGEGGQHSSLPRALGVPDLCIAGRTDLDAAAAEMVAQTVSERGIGSRVLPPIAISQNGIGGLDLSGVEVVCLSYLAADPQTFARFACRRLKKRAPHIRIIVCLWNPSPGLQEHTDLSTLMAADAVAFSVREAAAHIDRWVSSHPADPMQAAPVPENEVSRIEALRTLGLVTGDSAHFDDLAARVAAAFGTPIALVTLVDEKYQRWPGAFGLPPKLDACRMDDRETSVCGHVVAANGTLVVDDVAKDPRFANNPFLIENGIRFYAGVPLRTSTGFPVGSLCIIDTKPRSFAEEDIRRLRHIADDLMVKVESECELIRISRRIWRQIDEPAPNEMMLALDRLQRKQML